MEKIKYFIGPMSKNIVDAIMEYTTDTQNNVGLIPSRRQVELSGGYVHNWTTEEFAAHAQGLFLVRDHGGPGQGLHDDDGYESLAVDCTHLNMIHIDPWKKYPTYQDGTRWTIEMIKYCHALNPEVFYEVGTEESIRRFSTSTLHCLLVDLKNNLTTSEYNQIKYCVIQSGTSLKGNENTGLYDKGRLDAMVQMVNSHKLLSKEHNGDYLSSDLITEKFSLGLDSINIAPEFGQIETRAYLDKVRTLAPELLETLWGICYESKRWEKWVDASFNPEKNKEELINICGHYVLSHPEFLKEIKPHFPEIDAEIRQKVQKKLEELF